MRISLIPGKLNNRTDPSGFIRTAVDKTGTLVQALTRAENVRFDGNGVISLRSGRTKKLAGTPKSLFVDALTGFCFFLDGTVIKILNTDYTSSTVATLSSSAPLCYCPVNGELVASNGVDIGWLSGSVFEPFAPTLGQFEVAMPAGQYLAVYNGSLISASGEVLYVSKPYHAEVRDSRLSEFPLGGYVRMLAAVEDGLWVATKDGVAFISGSGVDEFVYRRVSKHAPADGAFSVGVVQTAEGERYEVRWASQEGICLGYASGRYVNLSYNDVALPSGASGRCHAFTENGTERILAVINNPVSGNIFTPK